VGLAQKEMVEELRVQWKKLWQERVDDKVRAEGVATADYCDLFVEKGTVIQATRNFKVLSFKEILKQHEVENADRFIPPPPDIGGWTKFIKMNITKQQPGRKRRAELCWDENKRIDLKPKKGDRGWLHL